jgi:hypothetical protein
MIPKVDNRDGLKETHLQHGTATSPISIGGTTAGGRAWTVDSSGTSRVPPSLRVRLPYRFEHTYKASLSSGLLQPRELAGAQEIFRDQHLALGPVGSRDLVQDLV